MKLHTQLEEEEEESQWIIHGGWCAEMTSNRVYIRRPYIAAIQIQDFFLIFFCDNYHGGKWVVNAVEKVHPQFRVVLVVAAIVGNALYFRPHAPRTRRPYLLFSDDNKWIPETKRLRPRKNKWNKIKKIKTAGAYGKIDKRRFKQTKGRDD